MIAQGFIVFLRSHGKKSVPARTLCLGHHAASNSIHGVAQHADAALGASGPAGSRPQQTQKIIKLGGCGYGGTWIAGCVFLTDGDGRRNAFDFVDVWFLHALKKLTGVR